MSQKWEILESIRCHNGNALPSGKSKYFLQGLGQHLRTGALNQMSNQCQTTVLWRSLVVSDHHKEIS